MAQDDKFCTNCGQPIEPGDIVCTHCGKPINRGAKAAEKSKNFDFARKGETGDYTLQNAELTAGERVVQDATRQRNLAAQAAANAAQVSGTLSGSQAMNELAGGNWDTTGAGSATGTHATGTAAGTSTGTATVASTAVAAQQAQLEAARKKRVGKRLLIAFLILALVVATSVGTFFAIQFVQRLNNPTSFLTQYTKALSTGNFETMNAMAAPSARLHGRLAQNPATKKGSYPSKISFSPRGTQDGNYREFRLKYTLAGEKYSTIMTVHKVDGSAGYNGWEATSQPHFTLSIGKLLTPFASVEVNGVPVPANASYLVFPGIYTVHAQQSDWFTTEDVVLSPKKATAQFTYKMNPDVKKIIQDKVNQDADLLVNNENLVEGKNVDVDILRTYGLILDDGTFYKNVKASVKEYPKVKRVGISEDNIPWFELQEGKVQYDYDYGTDANHLQHGSSEALISNLGSGYDNTFLSFAVDTDNTVSFTHELNGRRFD
ncbi:MAG TPA: zinc ribbon domain-containing protein [Aeriscardovia aeriphila]|uniref:Zinc ribbon domain-containing protein n=1 Tax=Aeriscardovia aeriphila TaxID=218139 RepID=A0A921KAN7_9BIFI|nr:zinc ribbon domain-containing protein [Aeriscardovia aeriphila]